MTDSVARLYNAVTGKLPEQARKAASEHISSMGESLKEIEQEEQRLVRATLRLEAEHFGWTARFARLVGAGDAAADKPSAAPILLALEAARASPGENIWYVGDTAVDMECAANAGCLGVLLHAEPSPEAGFERFPPALRFADCQAVVDHIKAL